MAYIEDKTIDGLDALTSLDDTDVLVAGDQSDSDRAKKITKANFEADLALTASQVSDFDTEVGNNSAVTANTAKVSFDSTSSTRLANTSGTNTGDQSLTTYQLKPSEGAFVDGDKTKLDGIEALADVTDATNVASSGGVLNTGNETIAGIKTFSSSPIVPAPTTDLQASTKKYVDDNSGDVTKVGTPVDNQVGVWTGDGTIEGTSGLTYDGSSLAVSGTVDSTAFVTDSASFFGSNITSLTGQELIKLSSTASAVNEITIKNNIASNDPEVQATGDDTNINLKLVSKGTGQIDFNGNYKFPKADGTSSQVLETDGSGALSWTSLVGGGDALVANPLSQFAATTSLQLKGVISDETGSGSVVFATSPTLVTPALGTPSALVATNATGTASGLTAGLVTNGVYTSDFPLNQDTTGNAGTVTTITGLAPDTATTQATQASITTCANLTTSGALNAGSITSGFGSIDVGASAIDGGVITADTNFAGNLTGNVTGNTSGSSGSCTGESATVATIAGLAPNTATTQATQASITSAANLVTVGTIGTGTWQGTAINQTYLTGQSGTNTGDEVASSSSVAGVAELAISSEIDTGTDTTRIIPIDQFVASKRNIRWLTFNLVEAGTDCATATNIAGDFLSPIAGTILQSDSAPFYIYATNSTAGVTGTMVVDVSIGGTSIMTTNKIDIDTTEKTSTTGATQPDLTTTALAVGDIITIDIDAVHSGTASKGLTLYMAIRE